MSHARRRLSEYFKSRLLAWTGALESARRHCPNHRFQRLRVEALEPREVLAGDFDWAVSLAAGDTAIARAVAVDSSGNVYSVGNFQGTADLDPGVGVTQLTSVGSTDAYVAKYSATGSLIWARQLGAVGDDQGIAVAVDGTDNVVISGNFQGTVDFDPGVGIAFLTSAGYADVFVAKFDSVGNYLWAKQLGGTNNDSGSGIAIDSAGNVLVTGDFSGTVDFDPGAGVANLSSGGYGGSYVVKLDSSGNYVWAKQFSAASGSIPYSQGLAIDGSDNVVVTGGFQGTVDFDPGAGAANLTADNFDVFVVKLNSSGDYVWANQFGSSNGDFGRSVAIDSFNNILVTGDFYGTVDFDPGAGTSNLTATVGTDLFVAKYDSSGNYVWAKQLAGGSYEQGRSVAVDFADNVIVSSSFTGTVDFDPGAGFAQLVSAGGDDAFVVKLDSAGNYLWAERFGGSGYDQSYAAAVDASGNVFITGGFQGTVDFDPGGGTYTLNAGASQGSFVWQLDSAGAFGWAAAPFVGSSGTGFATATDGSGNVFVTGNFSGTADFDPGNETAILTSAGSADIFVAKFDSAGNYLWAKQLGGTNNDFGYDIAIDSAGNVLVTGEFSGTADFDPGASVANLTSALGYYDAFIVKLDSNGNYVWAKQFVAQSGSLSESMGLAIDGSDNVVVTGWFQGTADFDPGAGTANLTADNFDVFVVKLNSSGDYVWANQFGSSNGDFGRSVAVDSFNNILVTGDFYGTVDFDPGAGTSNLTAAVGTDIFIAKYDSSGNYVWAKQLAGGSYEQGRSVAVDYADNVIIGSSFSGTVDFDPGAGVANLISVGGDDAFVLKLDSVGNYLWATQLGGSGSEPSYAAAVDISGNVFVTGAFQGTVDFNPGAETANLTSAGGIDIFVVKLNSSGDYVWAQGMGGTAQYGEFAYGVAVDATDHAIITGYFNDTVDFDPGPGTTSFTTSNAAGFVLRLSGNVAPVLATNVEMTLDEGTTAVIGNTLLRTTDVDNAAAQLMYLILDLPVHGILKLDGAALGTGVLFSQADIDAGKLTYTHNGDDATSDGFTFRYGDLFGLAAGTTQFSIAITNVNDAPSFAKGADVTVRNNGGPQSLVGWATNISPGSASESGQTLDFLVTNDNGALFATGGAPAIAADGTLSFTPAVGAAGTSTVTVRLHDDGGGTDTSAPQTFTITVTNRFLAVTKQPPTSVAAGNAFGLTVAVLNTANGKALTTYNGLVTIALGANPGGATLGVLGTGSLTVMARNGIATFANLTLDKASSGYDLQISTAGSPTATTNAVTIVPAAPSRMTIVSQPPALVTAGNPFGLSVQVFDRFGNLATNYGGNLSLSIAVNPVGGRLSGPTSVRVVNGVAQFNGLLLDKAAAGYQLQVRGVGSIPLRTDALAVQATTAFKLVFTTQPPSNITAGVDFPVVVRALDRFNNVATGFSGDVQTAISRNPGLSTLGGTTLVTAVDGVVTITGLNLNKAANGYQLQLTSAGLPTIVTGGINVRPAAAAQLVVTTQPPASVVAGAAFRVVVSARDAFGNTATGFTGSLAIVTAAPDSNPGGATLGGALTMRAGNGTATFGNLTLNKVGVGFTLQFSAAGLPVVVTNPLNVTVAAASQFLLTTPLPAMVAAGAPFALSVQVADRYGNFVTNFAKNAFVALASAPAGGSLAGAPAAGMPLVGGAATFADLSLSKVGVGYKLRVTAAGLPTFTTGVINVV